MPCSYEHVWYSHCFFNKIFLYLSFFLSRNELIAKFQGMINKEFQIMIKGRLYTIREKNKRKYTYFIIITKI